MPVVPPSTTSDVDRKQRKKLMSLFAERTVLGYTFSFEKLVKMVRRIDPEVTDEGARKMIESCIIAYTEDETKKLKADINDDIAAIFTENGIKTLRDADPFGNRMDFVYVESTSTSFSSTRCKELAPKFGIDTDVIVKLLEQSTTKTPFVTVQARRVKEGNGEEK